MHHVSFDPISNDADWSAYVTIIDDRTNLAFSDLSQWASKLVLSDKRGCSLITLTSANGGITYPQEGVAAWSIDRSEIARLQSGEVYRVGFQLTKDTHEVQIFTGDLPIIEGYIS